MQSHGFQQLEWNDLMDGDLCLTRMGIEVETEIDAGSSFTDTDNTDCLQHE